jgi:hypothetical protein
VGGKQEKKIVVIEACFIWFTVIREGGSCKWAFGRTVLEPGCAALPPAQWARQPATAVGCHPNHSQHARWLTKKLGRGGVLRGYPPFPLKTPVAALQALIIKQLTRCMTRCNPLLKAVATPKSLRIGVVMKRPFLNRLKGWFVG